MPVPLLAEWEKIGWIHNYNVHQDVVFFLSLLLELLVKIIIHFPHEVLSETHMETLLRKTYIGDENWTSATSAAKLQERALQGLR